MTCAGSIHCHRSAECADQSCPGHPIATANWADPARTDFAPLGYEAALPASFTADPPKKAREPIDWLAWIENTAGIAFLAFVGGGVVWAAFRIAAYFLAALSLY
jgi:hypothetical protein